MTPSMFETVPLSELSSKGLLPDTSPRRPVVLVVDDEKVIADTLVKILNHAGFAAMAAYTGESALEVADIVPPDLLLTDIVMPGINGFELARSIQRTIPDCQILMFSGQASTVDHFRDIQGFKSNLELLPKPVAPQDLITAISRLTGTLK